MLPKQQPNAPSSALGSSRPDVPAIREESGEAPAAAGSRLPVRESKHQELAAEHDADRDAHDAGRGEDSHAIDNDEPAPAGQVE